MIKVNMFKQIVTVTLCVRTVERVLTKAGYVTVMMTVGMGLMNIQPTVMPP